MTEIDKYKLSTYKCIKLLHETKTSKVEMVKCSLNGNTYIKKTYYSDKRSVFNVLKKINNVHIPEIYEVFFGESTIIIEQFVEGKTLDQKISEGETLSKKQIKAIINGLLEAIETLHKNNIVHRDIKPSNIIVTDSDEAVLIDYNISRLFSKKGDLDTELFGTVGYAAPEQFGFSQSDFRTDIYSLGITLDKIVSKKNSSKRLLKAVKRCAEFDPSKRFQNVEQLRLYINSTNLFYCIISVIVVLTIIGIVSLSIAMTNKADELTDEYAQSQQDQLSKPVDTTSEEQKSVIKNEIIINEYYPTRIVDTSYSVNGVPCIQIWDDGVYEAEIEANSVGDIIKIQAEKADKKYIISVNGETFEFINTYNPEVVSYPEGNDIAELLFYDMNNDNVLDIIPVICNAVITDFNDEKTVLKNYSVAWCIYSDSVKGYKLADDEMYAYVEPFKIYDSSPGCLWSDFPSYYKFDKEKIHLY